MTNIFALDSRLNLQHRQLIVVIGVSLTMLMLTTSVFFFNDYITLKHNIQDNIRNKATYLAANSLIPLQQQDTEAARNALKVASVDQHIQLAVLYDQQQTILAQFTQQNSIQALPKVFPEEGLIFGEQTASILLPVMSQGETSGWLYLSYDLGELQEKYVVYAKVAVAIFAIGLLIAWMMSTFSQKFVVEPIAQLAGLIERISRTKNYGERMYVARNDELGTLITGFNNMLSAIQDRETELQKHGERLESLVELRTQQLHHRANYDSLTGLPNRYLLMEKLHQAIESARRTNRNMALLLIDLDRFKIINDSIGHHVGDEMLQVLAKRLSSLSRVDDTVGRLGGDEFVILLGNVADPADAQLVAEKVMEELSEPFVLQHHRLHISASIGISVFPQDSTDALGLLRRADVSMYRSKRQGKSAYSFYDSALDNSNERLAMESKLRNAIKNNELYMVYQPQVCLNTHRITGVEALMRWQNSELGEVHPAEFIPIAVEIGLINELTIWAVDAVCRQHKVWQEQGIRTLKTAINVSATDLMMVDFVANVRSSIKNYGIDPCCIEIEITEDVFLERAEQITNALLEIKEMGVGVAIDDFGTGYSSLSYLRDFPVDVLKLDGSFVERILESSKSRGIVSSAISLAHGLGLQIVAECVETESQFEFLVAQGCDIIQGHYFSGPLAGDAMAIFVNQHEELLLGAHAVAS